MDRVYGINKEQYGGENFMGVISLDPEEGSVFCEDILPIDNRYSKIISWYSWRMRKYAWMSSRVYQHDKENSIKHVHTFLYV